jgi:hypothetical protein
MKEKFKQKIDYVVAVKFHKIARINEWNYVNIFAYV